MKSLEIIVTAFSLLGNVTCRCCHRNLVDDDEKGTIIKKHIVKTDKRKVSVEIDCRYCGHKNVIAKSS